VNTGIYRSRKSFHVVSEDGLRRLRVAFNPAVHCKFNPDNTFHPVWETSNFFDIFLPDAATYAEMSIFTESANTLLDGVQEFEAIGTACNAMMIFVFLPLFRWRGRKSNKRILREAI